MRKKVQIICLFLLTINILPICAQRLIVQDDGAVIIDTYGMNRDILALDPVLAAMRLKEGRTTPHSNKNSPINRLITPLFEIAPTDAFLGLKNESVFDLTWFQASGWEDNSYAKITPTGCPYYNLRGSMRDWRVPTFYEALLIRVFKDQLDQLDGKNEFEKLDSNSKYFTATGDDTNGKKNQCMYYTWGEASSYFGSMDMTSKARVRCIRTRNY